jgi:hypothetical protein
VLRLRACVEPSSAETGRTDDDAAPPASLTRWAMRNTPRRGPAGSLVPLVACWFSCPADGKGSTPNCSGVSPPAACLLWPWGVAALKPAGFPQLPWQAFAPRKSRIDRAGAGDNQLDPDAVL